MTTWAEYRANHPEVLASWGQQNGRQCLCTCARCDPLGVNRAALDERFGRNSPPATQQQAPPREPQ